MLDVLGTDHHHSFPLLFVTLEITVFVTLDISDIELLVTLDISGNAVLGAHDVSVKYSRGHGELFVAGGDRGTVILFVACHILDRLVVVLLRLDTTKRLLYCSNTDGPLLHWSGHVLFVLITLLLRQVTYTGSS